MPEMSRINSRRFQPQTEEILEPLRKIATLGKSEFSAGLENCWQVYDAQLQELKEVSIHYEYLLLYKLKTFFIITKEYFGRIVRPLFLQKWHLTKPGK